jgi:hypothetical protein
VLVPIGLQFGGTGALCLVQGQESMGVPFLEKCIERPCIRLYLQSSQLISWVVEGFSIPEPKTRYLVAKLNEFGVTGKALIVAGEGSEMLFRAGRNLPKVKVVSPDGLNVYDILHYDVLLVMENDMQKIQDIWS